MNAGPKIKKIFLVILLLMVSFVLSAVKLFSGEKGVSQAQAQCWSPPASGTSGGGCGCTNSGCSTAGSGGGGSGGGK